jgi:hypothetical protein
MAAGGRVGGKFHAIPPILRTPTVNAEWPL